jgi:hypothetical protein
MGKHSRKRRDGWEAYLATHEHLVYPIDLPAFVLLSEFQFRKLLGEGIVHTMDGEQASLSSLDATQWDALEKFCKVFFLEFESYDPLEQFLALKHELQRRGSNFRGN